MLLLQVLLQLMLLLLLLFIATGSCADFCDSTPDLVPPDTRRDAPLRMSSLRLMLLLLMLPLLLLLLLLPPLLDNTRRYCRRY